MRIIKGFDYRQEEAIAWARKRMGLHGPHGRSMAISMINERNQFVAVTVYSGFTEVNIDMHIAAKPGARWATPAYFNASFRFPFVQYQAQRITGLVRSGTPHIGEFLTRLGFVLEGRLRKAFPEGDDLLMYGFLKEDFFNHRWYDGGKHEAK
jgi:hypothetical protein